MIISFEGPMGSGKTLCTTAIAWEEHISSGRRVVANYDLNFEEYCPLRGRKEENGKDHLCVVPFNFELFMKLVENELPLTQCIMILDEAYLYFEARTSSSRVNRLFYYFMAQTRKRQVDLYVTGHQLDAYDKRLRRAIDVRGICRFNRKTQVGRIRFIDLRTGERRTAYIEGPKYYKYFDTSERVQVGERHVVGVTSI